MYHTEPPTDKTIREWYMNFSRVAACALRNEQAVRADRPGRLVYNDWLFLRLFNDKYLLHILPKAENAYTMKNKWELEANTRRQSTCK